jgi:DNA invertase Pin-like site-specific DNA recombinase
MRLPSSLDELKGRRAAHWGRESTGRQAERYGPAAQREQRVRAIGAYGMVDTGIEWQVAHSGRTIGTTHQFADMLARAGRDYDVLVVGYVSRFTRDLRTAVNARHQLHEAGAALLFADERVLSSDENAWENWARETVEAEAYSRRLARAVPGGYAAKVRDYADQGGGLVKVGFRRVGDRKLIEPDPATMPTATSVWELAAQGAADATIAAATDLSLWTVRGILRSPLYAGRLRDGRATRFAAPIDGRLIEQAHEHRRSRTRIGNRLRRNRTYALSGSGPAVCAVCERPIKGDTRTRRDGTKLSVYRHADPGTCPGWPVREVPTALLDAQIAALLRGAAPNRESAARIRAALARPVVGPDRLGIARLDARLRSLSAELVRSEQHRSTDEIVVEIKSVKTQRERLLASPVDAGVVDPQRALDWLSSLPKLWDETSDAGRRELAVATFARLGVVGTGVRGSHRIVSVEATEEAERRGLVLALPASIEVTVVGDTGFEPVTSRM